MNKVFGDKIKKYNLTIFGLFTISWVTKIVKYGESTRILGPKTKLQCGIKSPDGCDNTAELKYMLEQMLDIPTIFLPNFLTLALCPSNQIIHTGRIYGLFKDWDGKTPYRPEDIPTLYDEMDEYSAHILSLLDNEI